MTYLEWHLEKAVKPNCTSRSRYFFTGDGLWDGEGSPYESVFRPTGFGDGLYGLHRDDGSGEGIEYKERK